MTISKGTPQAVLHGIKDISARARLPEIESVPQHLPQVFILTERGDTLPQIVGGTAFNEIYGINSLDYASEFANHATVLTSKLLAAGNMILAQRIELPGASTATLRISAEVIPTSIQLYKRDEAGQIEYRLDPVNGQVPVEDGEPITGVRVIFHVGTDLFPTEQKAFGTARVTTAIRAGDTKGIDGITQLSSLGAEVTSTLYPVLEFKANSFGGFGDRLGLRLDAPHVDSASPANISLIESIKSFIYRFTLVERSKANTTYKIVNTAGEDTSLEAVLKENVVNPRLNNQMSMADIFAPAYEITNDSGTQSAPGPFSEVKVYEDSINRLLTLLTQGGELSGVTVVGEKDFDLDAAMYGRTYSFEDEANKHMLNLFTGVDYNNVPYHAFRVDNAQMFGGVSFANGAVHYASGGSDGLVYDQNGRPDKRANLKLFDLAVRHQLENWGDLEAKMLDAAYYPVSTIWDSGFSIDTKKSMLIPMSKRKDVYVVLSTEAVADWVDPNDDATWQYMPQNSLSEEIAIGTMLATSAQLFPESELHGTSTCRALIVGQSGKLADGTWAGFLPLTIDLAVKAARYMGAADGYWKQTYRFDESPGNQVTDFIKVNNTYRNIGNANRSWDANIIYVQNYSRDRLYYPAFQTVYDDDTSVLNSWLTMAACCNLERVAQSTWRDITGGEYTPEQVIDRSNRLITERTEGRYDGRYRITPNTYYTKADVQRGYSYSADIKLEAPFMTTVGQFTIVADRLDSATQAAN